MTWDVRQTRRFARIYKKLHDNVVTVGNSIDPAVGYRTLMGRDVDVKAYLRDKGFPTA